MASLYIRNGTYWIKYRAHGQLVRASLRTKNDKIALDMLEDIKAALRYDLIGLPSKNKTSPLLAELFDEYLIYMKKHREPNTHRHAELYVRLFLRPAFGHLRANQLTDKHIEDFVGKLKNWTMKDDEGNMVQAPYHPETINKRLKCLSTILKRASRPGGAIDKIPVDISNHLLKTPRPLPKYVTPEQFAAWWPHITRPLNRWRAVIALCTGIPDSELARLRWDRNYVEEWNLLKYTRGKTTKDISVKLNKWGIEAITELKKLRQGPYLFHGIKDARKAYEIASKNSGIKVSPHMLRHSFATWALSGGEALAKIGAILGHASLSTTQRYAHVIPQFLAETTGAIDRMRPQSLRRRAPQETHSGTKRAHAKKRKRPATLDRP